MARSAAGLRQSQAPCRRDGARRCRPGFGGHTNGLRVLADLKTLSRPGSGSYCTRAQLGGYMALEAAWGVHYDAGQTIWARPGETRFSPLYSREECLAAWAAAWAGYVSRFRHW